MILYHSEQRNVTVNGARLLLIRQKHLGSDYLPGYIEDICKYLINFAKTKTIRQWIIN